MVTYQNVTFSNISSIPQVTIPGPIEVIIQTMNGGLYTKVSGQWFRLMDGQKGHAIDTTGNYAQAVER